MALQIRRGLEADLPASPADGELLYATDTNKLYVGDGGVAQEISGGSGLVNIIEDTTPQLGADLDVNGSRIISANNGNITIAPNGTGKILLNSVISAAVGITIAPTSTNYSTSPAITNIGDPTNGVDGSLSIRTNSFSTAPGSGLSFGQAHTTVGVVPALLYRARGTIQSPAAVILNDRLGATVFAGHDGTTYTAGASISAAVTGSVSTNSVPTKIVFSTHNGTSLAPKAEISEAGILRTNSIANFSGASLTLTATTVNIVGNMQLNAQNDLRFADADSTNWVAFQAPATVAANVTWTLPATDGTTGQVLATNGSGTLSWVASGGGAGFASRVSIPGTTATLANGATGNITIAGFKGYILYKIETSVAAWVRIYTTSAARSADSSRTEGVDPLPGAGVLAEVITTGAATISMTPGVIGFNDDNAPTSSIYLAITNKSGTSSTVTTTLTILQIEG
jgi:hypothetical protein